MPIATLISLLSVKTRKGSDAMPTRNVNLTTELNSFIVYLVRTGRYENASEVVRAALRAMEREEKEYDEKLKALRAAIDAGDASGIAEGDVVGRVFKRLNLPDPRIKSTKARKRSRAA